MHLGLGETANAGDPAIVLETIVKYLGSWLAWNLSFVHERGARSAVAWSGQPVAGSSEVQIQAQPLEVLKARIQGALLSGLIASHVALVVIDVIWAHSEPREVIVVSRLSTTKVDCCEQGSQQHMANAASFMNHQTHDNIAAPPSQTFPALTLLSTAQHSLDPLWGNDPWVSAVALRPAQHQQQLEIPFWPQQEQGSEIWPHSSCQSQTWQTPRWPLRMARPTPPTPRGTPSHSWQPPLPPPPTWNATSTGFVRVDGSRQDDSWIGWNRRGKEYKGGGSATMEITKTNEGLVEQRYRLTATSRRLGGAHFP